MLDNVELLDNIELINFIDLSLEEKKMILKWRNAESIRTWMYNQDEISLDEHLNFINSLKLKKDKLYFLVKRENDSLGVIDFTNINKESLNMGLYTNPDFRGLGKLFLEIIIYYSFKIIGVKSIIAEVFTENKRAYTLYKNFGFNTFDLKSVNNREVKCMELINEDW